MQCNCPEVKTNFWCVQIQNTGIFKHTLAIKHLHLLIVSDLITRKLHSHVHFSLFWITSLDGRNRTRVIAESLARVVAAIRITSVRWQSYITIKTQNSVLIDPAFRCTAIRIARLAFVGVVFVPRGSAEWPARVDRVRWTLAIDDWRFGPSNQGPLNGGGFQTGAFPDLDLCFRFCPFLSFLGLSRFFRDCSGMVRGFSRFVPFLFLGLLRAPARNSPERVRDTIWTFPEKVGNPPVWKHPGLASLKIVSDLITKKLHSHLHFSLFWITSFFFFLR